MSATLRRLAQLALLPLPLARADWLLGAVLTGIVAAAVACWSGVEVLDHRLYDHIVASNPRSAPAHTARVVFDDDLPLSITRMQTITLEALAAERLIRLGARAVFLDAQLVLRNYRKDSFIACLAPQPRLCTLRGEHPCLTEQGRPRSAPLDLDDEARQRLILPAPLADSAPPAYDQLFGTAAPPRLAATQLSVAADGVIRDVPGEGAQAFLPAMLGATVPAGLRRCFDGRPGRCLPLRFGAVASNPPLTLSRLASCDDASWHALAPQIAGRYVVLQMNNDRTPEDIHMTPLLRGATPLSGLIGGSRLLTDAIDTSLHQDAPRAAPLPLVWAGGLCALLLAIAAFACLRTDLALCALLVLPALLWQAAPYAYPYAIWPVSALLIALSAASAAVMTGHMWLNTRQNGMLARFMPPQVRRLLLQRGTPFDGRELNAVVLMSDLAGYTTITGILSSPRALFDLLNHYLDEITTGLQEDYGAWLESYVGDMLCYYWPHLDDDVVNRDRLRRAALQTAVLLMTRQQAFFAGLPAKLTEQQRQRMPAQLFAGIALTEGKVHMGEQGPARGVRKFGILGDPPNLAARLEGLTRRFSARLIVTGELIATAAELGLQVRPLAVLRVKGRLAPVAIWALHRPAEGIAPEELLDWSAWRTAFEADGHTPLTPPARFTQDAATLCQWRQSGCWNLGEQCYDLDSK